MFVSFCFVSVNVVILVLLSIAFLIIIHRNLLNLSDFLKQDGSGTKPLTLVSLSLNALLFLTVQFCAVLTCFSSVRCSSGRDPAVRKRIFRGA